MDTQADVNLNRPELEDALQRARNSSLTVHVFDQANHLVQEAITGSIAEHNDLPRTFVPGSLEVLTEWIVDHPQ